VHFSPGNINFEACKTKKSQMMKALSLFLLVFSLALTPVFSQGTHNVIPADNGDKNKKAEPNKLEASVSPAEQAERDLLVPRKYQEQLAVEASKPIKYGPSTASRKTYSKSSRYKKSSRYRKTTSRGKSSGKSSSKKRSSGRRHR
jgi:hypothetical protein